MAEIQCTGCGAYLSVKGLVNCPHCQAYLNPAHHTDPVQVQAQAPKIGLKTSELIGFTAVFGVVAMIGLIIYLVVSPSDEKTSRNKARQALVQCQYAIQSYAKFGDAEMPPPVKNYGRSGEFYFSWAPGSFHFTNGFGAREKMSASCIGSLDTGAIMQLTINGKDAL